MKKYLIAYMNNTIRINDTQRIYTTVFDFDHIPTLMEAFEHVNPRGPRTGAPEYEVIAISEIGGW